MKTRVRLFGAWRDLYPCPTLELEQPQAGSLQTIGELLVAEILRAAPQQKAEPVWQLLRASAWANEREVLAPQSQINPGSELALLPPVCGG